MSPQEKYLGCLYIAWGLLLLATSFFQQGTGRRACLLGVLGFGLLGANLFVQDVILRNLVRVVALATLAYAGWLSFRIRSGRTE